jgi:glycosyltransferase involved in cell wall biosynthesis
VAGLRFDASRFCAIMAFVKQNNTRAIHVGVNAHLLSVAANYRSAGINWYIQNLIRHLPDADPEFQYTIFLGEQGYAGTRGLALSYTRLPTHRPAVRFVWEQAIQPWVLRREAIDLLHSPALVGPILGGRPFVVTVHDLSYHRYPEAFRTANRGYLTLFGQQSVRRARRVIAVSQSTKDDLVKHYGLSPARVDVVYHGVDKAFRPLPPAEVAAFGTRQGLPERFLLFVGTLEPRKNVARLVEAYARLPQTCPPLVLVGGKGWFYEEILSRVEELGLASRVRLAGYVPAEDLPYWYNAAEVLVYPSLYEGFGLPPLEAMACGTPVISSTASSLPEVVGDAGLLVDPADVDGLTSAMERVLRDAGLREQMRTAGLHRAQRFNWQAAARQTVDSYRRALAQEGGAKGV